MYAPTQEELHLLLDIIASLHHGDSSRCIRQQIKQALLQLLRADYLASYVKDNASGRFEDCVAVNIGADRLALYEEYFQHHDPITPMLLQRRQATLVSAVIAQSELEKTEFFNDFLIRGGLRHGIDLHLHDGDRQIGDLRIWRARQQPQFGQREVTLLATLQRQRAAGTDRRSAARDAGRLSAGDRKKFGERATLGRLSGHHGTHPVRPASAGRHPVQLVSQQRPLPAVCDSVQCFGLSQREAQVCSLVLQGRSDKEISRQLSISFPTVRTHLGHIFPRAGVTSRTELLHQVSLRQR